MELPTFWEARLADVGALLEYRGQTADVVIAGGAALARHGVRVEMPTVDVDVLAAVAAGTVVGPPLPPSLVDAARIVASEHGLADDWLNGQVAATYHEPGVLPAGLLDRAEAVILGGLTMRFVSRLDLIALKLHAAVDNFAPRATNEKHRDDLRMLAPTPEELAHALSWISETTEPGDAIVSVAREIIEDDHGS